MTDITAAAERPADRSLLIVENDKCALTSLARTMEGCGFTVTTAESVADGLQQIERAGPAFAVIELTFADGHGLALISALKLRRPGTRAIVLTSSRGYCNCRRSRETRRRGLSHQAGQRQRRRRGRSPTRRGHRRVRTTGKTDVCRSCSLGAHSAHLRALRPQCLGNVAPAQHASAHIAAHSGETLPKLIISTIARKIRQYWTIRGRGDQPASLVIS